VSQHLSICALQGADERVELGPVGALHGSDVLWGIITVAGAHR
jgi:hypothetical protein